MPMQRMCKIVEKVMLNPYAVSMALDVGELSREISYGQFVNIKCGEGLLLRRPISICDWQEGVLRIVFEVRGEGTDWLARRDAGEYLDVMGPLGRGFRLDREGRYLLVGGGIGVPPLLSCAVGTGRRSTAVLGFRSADRAMLLGDFAASCAGVRVCSDDGSLGTHGFVDGVVKEILEQDKDFTAVLACGPKPMLRAVAAAAQAQGVPCQVSMEERMGCGVGACLVCACKTADGHYHHVCKDGPVFDAGEVDWNA